MLPKASRVKSHKSTSSKSVENGAAISNAPFCEQVCLDVTNFRVTQNPIVHDDFRYRGDIQSVCTGTRIAPDEFRGSNRGGSARPAAIRRPRLAESVRARRRFVGSVRL